MGRAITPELIEQARTMQAQAEARANELPKCVNRRVLVLLPKGRFFAWHNAWHAHGKSGEPREGTEADRWACSRAYLLPCLETHADIDRFVAEHRKYFLHSYVMGHMPRTRWPWEPTVDEFDAWFECRVVAWCAWDLSDEPLEASPDNILAMSELFS